MEYICAKCGGVGAVKYHDKYGPHCDDCATDLEREKMTQLIFDPMSREFGLEWEEKKRKWHKRAEKFFVTKIEDVENLKKTTRGDYSNDKKYRE